jgi:hypothetical protein
MSNAPQPRFVILRHTMPAGDCASHWDLMLESSSALRTWALAEEPTANKPIAATALAEHRLEYLDYEGPISGNRGHVTRWDRGQVCLRHETADELLVVLVGERLQGHARLTRNAALGCNAQHAQRWTFSFVADPICASAGGSASESS